MYDQTKGLTKFQSQLVELSFLVSRFSVMFPGMITSLLLIDIGLTFGESVGVISQMRTAASVMAIIISIAISVISLRFEHRKLLLTGLGIYTISAFLCSIAPNYISMLLAYSIIGMAGAMSGPMTNTLIAAYFPQEKRSGIIGQNVASAAGAYLIGMPLIYYFSTLGGWRSTFGILTLGISIITLIISLIALRAEPLFPQTIISEGYSKSFISIFNNKSALTCIIAPALTSAAWASILVFSASFRRERFLLGTDLVTVLMMGSAFCYIAGSLGAGRVIKKIGRKESAVIFAFLLGVFAMAYTNVQDLWLNVVCSYLASLFAGIRNTAHTGLTLEQVPEYRSTMMSLYSVSDSIGAALGTGLGGLLLIVYNYEGLALVLGAMALIASLFIQKYAVDNMKSNN